MKDNLYLKIILTIIAILLVINLFIRTDFLSDKVYGQSRNSEFQEQFKFILGPQSNIRGNLMVLEYPGRGIYYINLDNVDEFFEARYHIEFEAGSKKFKVQKPEYFIQTDRETTTSNEINEVEDIDPNNNEIEEIAPENGDIDEEIDNDDDGIVDDNEENNENNGNEEIEDEENNNN